MLWKIAKAGSDPTVVFAGEELARCLRAMDSAAEIALLAFPQYDASITNVLWLGVCPEVSARVAEPALDDAYSIHVEKGCGSIRGSNPRSVLLGVYRFLRELGCAWVRPGTDGEILPKLDTSNACVHLEDAASYRHRGLCIEGSVSYQHVSDTIDWLPKVGYNAYFNQFNNPVCFYGSWYNHAENPQFKPEPMSSAEIAALRDQSVAEIKKRGLLYHAAGHGWTCEPFGIPGESWTSMKEPIPEASVQYLAEVGGKRALWGGVPLNTNLCYSNPVVRQTIADAVAARCKEIPEIDYVQVWLADGTNNHCECENCQKMRPSDWYVTLLNDIDEKLTAMQLPTKVVFLLYVDLLWEPLEAALKNPDRFVMMFAPITRTYSASIADAPEFDESQLPPYERNRLQFPSSVSENLAWMRRWRKQFSGDGFDFDYHFMWDHFLDPGYYTMAETLFRDMQSLHKVGLNGMISCQNQRVFFPTGLGMTAMAAALWDEKADFRQVADTYFRSAFGPDGEVARAYLESLSSAFDSSYLRGEKGNTNAEAAEKFSTVPGILEAHRELIVSHAEDPELPENIRASWNYLRYHAELCGILAPAMQLLALGDAEAGKAGLKKAAEYARRTEPVLHHVFDAHVFQDVVGRLIPKNLNL